MQGGCDYDMSIIPYIIAFLLFAGSAFGANVYIDPECGSPGDGSTITCSGGTAPLSAWPATISSANDYRQKCGTIFTDPVNPSVTITASGSSGDHIIIGAYNDDGSHEDGGNETFGTTCSGGELKPILRGEDPSGLSDYDLHNNGYTMFTMLATDTSQYIEFNSISVQTVQNAIYMHSKNNYARYCYFYRNDFSVRLGIGGNYSDYNTIEYNFFDHEDQTDEGTSCGGLQCGYDPVGIGTEADNNLVQYNHITGYDHGGVSISYGAGGSNVIQYNYIYGKDGHEDFGVGTSGDSDIYRYNYLLNGGQALEINGGSSNEFYGNIAVCNTGTHPADDQGCLELLVGGSIPVDNNKIYNNTVYNSSALDTNYGIRLYASGRTLTGTWTFTNGDATVTANSDGDATNQLTSSGWQVKMSDGSWYTVDSVTNNDEFELTTTFAQATHTDETGGTNRVKGTFENNEIYNNVFHTIDDYCIAIWDQTELPKIEENGNSFYNNSCYVYDTNKYAKYVEYDQDWGTIDSELYTTATAFNNSASADAANNRDDDPGMEDPAAYEFWPASGSSNIVGAGYDLGSVYDDLLDPDTTDFTATPPEVDITPNQPASWYIGAYEVSGAAPPAATQQLQGISLQGVKMN